jgi:AcrR family transcriptional regulator
MVDLIAEMATPSRVEARRAESRRQVLGASWRLATESGIAALSLREIAASLGMKAPSLYSYFPSKAAIFDAMFIDGYRALDDLIDEVTQALPGRASSRLRLQALLRAWLGFCQTDPARYRLLFTNAVPGWTPSESAYAASVNNFEHLTAYLKQAGVVDSGDVDLCTALASGLVAQQMANDPEGDRWLRRVDDVVDMLLTHISSRAKRDARLSKATP